MKMPIKCTEFLLDSVDFGDRLYGKFLPEK